MTVAELIEQLKKHSPEERVVVKGYEDGFDDVIEVSELILKLNHNSRWYYGEHEKSEDETGMKAVCLKGNRRRK